MLHRFNVGDKVWYHHGNRAEKAHVVDTTKHRVTIELLGGERKRVRPYTLEMV